MAENTDASTQDGNSPSEPTSVAGDEFKPITTQDDLNRVVAERVARERAKYVDYKALKEKAEKFDELDAANKSEIEKANDRLTAAERERDAARSESMRLRVAAKHGITDEDADLFLTGTDEETLTKQAQRLADRASERKKNGTVVPREGRTPHPPQADDMREYTRQLFASND